MKGKGTTNAIQALELCLNELWKYRKRYIYASLSTSRHLTGVRHDEIITQLTVEDRWTRSASNQKQVISSDELNLHCYCIKNMASKKEFLENEISTNK